MCFAPIAILTVHTYAGTRWSQDGELSHGSQERRQGRQECHIPSMRAILSPFALVHPLPINYQPILPTC